jgi:hypothetical protein
MPSVSQISWRSFPIHPCLCLIILSLASLCRVVDGNSNPEGIVNIPAMVQGGMPVNPPSDAQLNGGAAANNGVAAGAGGDQGDRDSVKEHRDGVMPGAGPDGKTKLQLASSKNYRMEFATVKASVDKVRLTTLLCRQKSPASHFWHPLTLALTRR